MRTLFGTSGRVIRLLAGVGVYGLGNLPVTLLILRATQLLHDHRHRHRRVAVLLHAARNAGITRQSVHK